MLGFLSPGEYVSLKEVEQYLNIKNGMPVVKSLLAKHYVRVKEKVDEAFREKKVAMITRVGTLFRWFETCSCSA